MVERRLISISSQLQLLERLQHITYLSSSVIFVSGDSGSGKSTLIEQLSNKISNNVQQVFIQLHEQLSDQQIRQQIITQFYEQPLFDAQDNLFSSMSLLQEKQPADLPRLIILDNARYLSQNLLLELLQLTMQKEQFGDSEINVLLLAEVEDNQKMLAFINQTHVQKRDACLEFKLAALDSNEANALLTHLFKQDGYIPQVQHQDALQKQLLSCAGNPKKIIDLAEKILAGELQYKEPSWLKTRLPAVLLMLVLLMIVAAIGSYLYPMFIKPVVIEVVEPLDNENVLLEDIPATQLTTTELKLEAAQADLVEELAGNWVNKEAPDIQDNQLSVGVGDKVEQRVTISDNGILNLEKVNSSTTAAVDKLLSAVDVNKSQFVTDIQPFTTIKNLQVTEKQQPVEYVNEIQSVSEPLRLDEDIQSLKDIIDNQPLQTAQQKKDVDSVTETTIVAAIPEIEEVQDAEVLEDREYKTKRTAAKNSRSSFVKKNSSLFTSPAQLLAVSPSHYTLQLSGMASEKTLQEFISDYNLPAANVYIYQTLRKNKPWYVVIFGDYKSRQSALQASKKLPGAFANMDTWIKKYQLVHQDLRLNNE